MESTGVEVIGYGSTFLSTIRIWDEEFFVVLTEAQLSMVQLYYQNEQDIVV
jgi:hypothetical protein